MNKIVLLTALLVLSGCTPIDEFGQVVGVPAPAGLAGYWQTRGPQSELVSPEVIASLVVTASGDTLDCRQWQRVIALPGKLTLRDDNLYNVTVKRELYPLAHHGDTLEYAGMTLQRVARPTQECADALANNPLASTLP